MSRVDFSELTDEQLAAEAQRERSSGPAFTALVERFRDRVWALCYRLMGNEHDAADAAQEVLVRLFMDRAKFEGRSKYSTWLHSVTVRTCLMLRRGRGRRQKRVAVVSDEAIEQQAGTKEDTQVELSLDMQQMLETLDDEDRAMILLKFAEGHSYEELSEIFGHSVSACKMRISRARKKLQERFGT
ncbi:MAG: RNA polymerase sigma factor [Pirellulales bacterium]|nr:RNA polymerase sigma factor [Pirellulales bacterium]